MWLPEILNKMLFYMEIKNSSSVTVCDAMEYNINVTNAVIVSENCLIYNYKYI